MTEARKLRLVVAERRPGEDLRAAFAGDPNAEIAGQASDGLEAVAMTGTLRPDAVIIDAHIPRIDGFEATRRIMAETPTPIVIVSENLNDGELAVSMEALRAGALAAVSKPVRGRVAQFEERSAALIATVRAMADVKVVRRRIDRPAPARPLPLSVARRSKRPAIVALGASTGGPAALYRILSDLPGDFAAPIVVTQHISPGFVGGMVRWLHDAGPLRVKLGEAGEPIEAGTVYVAPDERHMTVTSGGRLDLIEGPVVDGHRPSATVMFHSVAESFGTRAMAVILTGMGRDGADGLEAIQRAGGAVLAQDEASSIVFGMPAAAIDAGYTDFVVPLGDIAGHLVSAMSRS